MKGMIHMILPVLLALVIFVSQPVTTLAAEELYPYQLYEAQYYAQHFEETLDLESGSYARNFYNALSGDGSFMATIQAWEAIHIATDPSYSLESGMITLRDFYRTVLFDLLCIQTSMDDVSEYADGLYNSVTNDYNKLLVDCTSLVLAEHKLTAEDVKAMQLTEDQAGTLMESSGLADAAEDADKLFMLLRGCKSIYDGIELTAKYCAIHKLNDGTREVLEYIGNDPDNEYELRMAALDLVECFQGGYEQAVQALSNGTSLAVQGLAGTFVDKAWDTLVMKIPGAAQVFVAAKGVRCLVNLFGDADAKVKAFYQIKASVLCEDALRRAMDAGKDAFCVGMTGDNAMIYLRAVRMFESTVLLGFDYSVEMLRTIEGSFQGIILGNSDDAAALIAQIKSLKTSRENIFIGFDDLLDKNYVLEHGTVYEDLLEAIQTDYPSEFGYAFNEDGKTIVVCDYFGTDGDLRIPEIIDGYVVTRVYLQRDVDVSIVTSVRIPKTVKHLDSLAFYGFVNLTSVTLFDGTDIGAVAFKNCKSLRTVSGWVGSVEAEAFRGCTNLQSITFAGSAAFIDSAAFAGCDSLTAVTIPGSVASIGEDAFSDCGSLTSLTIGDGVEEIGESAFWNCDALTSVTIPGSVQTIGYRAFEYCSSLTEITLPEGLTALGYMAFRCTGLVSVTLPNSLSTLNTAFKDNRNLQEIHISEGVTQISCYAFDGCDNLRAIWVDEENPVYADIDGLLCSKDKTELILAPEGIWGICFVPEGITVIDEYAFQRCESLKALVLPDSVTSIDTWAFGYCFALESVTFGQGLTEIGEYAFFSDPLTELVFPAALPGLEIGYEAFGYCVMVSVELPEGTSEIGSGAFAYCSSLASVAIPESATYVAGDAFGGCGSLTDIYYMGSQEQWNACCQDSYGFLKGVTVHCNWVPTCDHAYVADVIAPTCTEDGYTLRFCELCGTASVGDYTAALGHSYVGVVCERCGVNASGSCGEDTTWILDSQGVVTVSGTGSIADYDVGEAPWFAYDVAITKVIFKEGVTYVGECAFYDCPMLTTVEVPVSVTTFAYDAFGNCPALAEVYYGGTQEQWQWIGFYYGNEVLLTAQVHYVQVKPTVQPLGAGLAFKDEIQYNAYFTVSNPSNVEITEMGLLTWASQIDGTVENAENVLPGAVEEGDILKVRSQPIPAKNMGDTVYMKVYLKLADGTYVYSELLNYSAKVYAMNMLDNEKADASTKALCVAMLNYGAEAQSYFGYRTDALMNADLTAEQQALVSGYNEDMIPSLNSAETDIVCTGGFKSMSASVNFGGALGINYIFKPAKAMDGEMKLYVWTSADEALTFENASQVLTMEERAGMYTARVGTIAARNAGNTVYVCGVYESDGVQYTTGVLTYSVSAYCKALANTSGAFQPMTQAAAVYAYYANICLN